MITMKFIPRAPIAGDGFFAEGGIRKHGGYLGISCCSSAHAQSEKRMCAVVDERATVLWLTSASQTILEGRSVWPQREMTRITWIARIGIMSAKVSDWKFE